MNLNPANSTLTLVQAQQKRADMAVKAAIYIMLANGLVLLVIEGAMGQYINAALDVLLLFICAAYFAIAKHHKRVAAHYLFWIVFGYLCFVAYSDAPYNGAPRTQHLYFIPLALMPHVIFFSEKSWVRYSYTFISVIMLLYFTISDTGNIITDPGYTDSARYWMATFNAVIAGISTLVVIHIIHINLDAAVKTNQQLGQAVFEKQLELFFQPQVNSEGKLTGAEALIRWHHPTSGLLTPIYFIPFAEKSGSIIEVGRWVLGQACAQLEIWQQNPAFKHFILSVNVSVRELTHPDFAQMLYKTIQKYDINPSSLRIEITESAFIDNLDAVVTTIQDLQQKGITFSLDDFGMGYSSLNHLRQLPLFELKIDKQFTKGIPQNEYDVNIVKTMIELGKSLGLSTIAEGVENEAQWHCLKEFGCEYFQGFLFGKPMSASAFSRKYHLQTSA